MTVNSDMQLTAPIEVKAAWAKQFYRDHKQELMRDPSISSLLAQLQKAVRLTQIEMRDSGLTEACRICEEKEGGSCCGQGIEDRYDGILILINLLLGVTLSVRGQDPQSCFFLGERGCLLSTRHVICVNYLCEKLIDQMDSKKLAYLREKEGEELETLFRLHEVIKNKLKGL